MKDHLAKFFVNHSNILISIYDRIQMNKSKGVIS